MQALIQGYFVYDSKKSGAKTVSHLRFGPQPIYAPYLISKANFIACHQSNFVEKLDMLQFASEGAIFLLNSPQSLNNLWSTFPKAVQENIVQKHLKVFVIDANKVAAETGMGSRINTIMQTCFFALSGVLSRDESIYQIKKAIEKSYSKKGQAVVDKNFEAVDKTLANLFELEVPKTLTSSEGYPDIVPFGAPDFIRQVTGMMMAGRGDELPVSAMPVDGTFPTGTTKWEKRNIAEKVPHDQFIGSERRSSHLVTVYGIRSPLSHQRSTNSVQSSCRHHGQDRMQDLRHRTIQRMRLAIYRNICI